MSVAPKVQPPITKPQRQWLAKLDLTLAKRGDKTALTELAHLGPLRVQRPFYPEGPENCHIYLLHPPGGLVVGDELTINAKVNEACRTLITTPSAGKIYAVPGGGEQQQQHVVINAEQHSFVEWMPQETLIFDGANGKLHTQFFLNGNAQLFAWDIVCLGRPASQLPFTQGQCTQHIEVWRDQTLSYVEKNHFQPGAEFMQARWGLNSATTSGTLLATLDAQKALSRDQMGSLLDHLNAQFGANNWGITQKHELFIARYLGSSALACRRGFEHIWQQLRPIWCNQPAVVPRIWLT